MTRGLAVSLLACVSGAQVDLAKRLVGKWEGEVGLPRDRNRTLVIESVTQNGGKWMAEGQYGISGKGLGKVQIEVDEGGGKPWIRFVPTGDAGAARAGAPSTAPQACGPARRFAAICTPTRSSRCWRWAGRRVCPA